MKYKSKHNLLKVSLSLRKLKGNIDS